jgi:TorA maturation chaperone TorD
MNVSQIRFERQGQGEEAARAELYAVLAMLFYAPPLQDLLEEIGPNPVAGEGLLVDAWRELQQACRETDAEQVRDEYETLFIGVGKPEVFLYGSYYLSGFMMEKPLAQLRTDLARLGLERVDDMPESEDHFAALCDVMRFLILSGEVPHGNIATQKEFFATHIQPWAYRMCNAVIEHPQARFYNAVARLAKAFVSVEMQAFDMM